MIEVTVKDNEPFEKALRRFKKKWEKAGVLREVKSRSFYLKPSEEKKIARSNAILLAYDKFKRRHYEAPSKS